MGAAAVHAAPIKNQKSRRSNASHLEECVASLGHGSDDRERRIDCFTSVTECEATVSAHQRLFMKSVAKRQTK